MNHAAPRPGETALPPRGARIVAERVHAQSHAVAEERRYEGLVTRAIALAIDGVVVNGVAIVVAGTAALALSALSLPDSLDPVLVALGGALFLAWSIGYFVVFWSTTGQTPGNRLMRIRVCGSRDGEALSARRSLLRFACLTLAALPLLAGFLPVLLDGRRRGLHDMLAGTVVVEAPPRDAGGAGPR